LTVTSLLNRRQSVCCIFAWASTADWNRQQGNVPTDGSPGRWPSVLTALGVIPMFLLGWWPGAQAYPAALLTLHPVIREWAAGHDEGLISRC
jgi:hypothetical protein